MGKRSGIQLTQDMITNRLKHRFWSKVEIKDTSSCWPWKASFGYRDYGKFKFLNTYVSAHRIAYLVTKGDVPQNLIVLHTCDNPSCCNPEHLGLGTIAENNWDRATKGRNGNCGNMKKLKDEDILVAKKLREAKISYTKIGSIFQVSKYCARHAVKGLGVYE